MTNFDYDPDDPGTTIAEGTATHKVTAGAETAFVAQLMQPRCASCSHWKPDKWSAPDAYDVNAVMRDDGRITGDTPDAEGHLWPQVVIDVTVERWGVCDRIEHGWGGSPRAYTLDASGYASHLYARFDFGCVEHQPNGHTASGEPA